MASVNIDSKLIKKRNSFESDFIDTLELQNGCICCSLAEDMMASIRQFIHMSEERNIQYDHILLECSGVAEPRRVRDIFNELAGDLSSGLSTVSLNTFVTVVDAKVFYDLFGTDQTIAENRMLAVGASYDADTSDEDALGQSVNSDYLDESAAMRSVTELLLEQVECADVVLINKTDLLENPEADIERIRSVIRSLNPSATIQTCEYGAVPSPREVIGMAGGRGVAKADIVQEHKRSVLAAEDSTACSHPSHDHSHSHSHSDHCTEAAHNDSSDHRCTHDHGHESQSHSHDHDSEETTALKRFRISSFVYKRRKPFHPVRFYNFLRNLGKLSIKSLPDVMPVESAQNDSARSNYNLLRSKGFVWLGSSSGLGYYMSHSGQFLEMNILGDWWANIPRADWPEQEAVIAEITEDFEGEFGDRRQELIFIGQFKDPAAQKSMESDLDSCLLSDEELEIYKQALLTENPEEELRHKFVVDEDSA